jgi:hypothetical protein
MHKFVPVFVTAATFFASAASAQQRPARTAEDYARAERASKYDAL